MDCKQVREHLLEMADPGTKPVVSALTAHVDACPGCAEELASLRATMSALDAWQAPEPSPYFDARLRARLRDVPAPRFGWLGSLEWLRKPALAAAMAVLLFSAVVLFQGGSERTNVPGGSTVVATAEPGTAVADLQALDKNAELFSSFELLDEVEVDEVNQ